MWVKLRDECCWGKKDEAVEVPDVKGERLIKNGWADMCTAPPIIPEPVEEEVEDADSSDS